MRVLVNRIQGAYYACMADDFLTRFVGNTTRAKLLRLFFFNQTQSFTLPQAARRVGINPKAVAKEISFLEKLNLVRRGRLMITLANGTKRAVGGKQREPVWTRNETFKYTPPLSKFVHEVSPVHYKNIIVGLRRSGRVAAIILSGSFMGDDTRPADLIIAGDSLNESRLEIAVRALERSLGREIRYAAFTTPEFRYRMTIQDRLLRDTLDYPHLVLLDKTRLL